MQTRIQFSASLFVFLIIFPASESARAALVGYWDFELSADDRSGNDLHGLPEGTIGTELYRLRASLIDGMMTR